MMTRRNFFSRLIGTLGVLISVPVLAKVQNKDIRKYPYTYAESFYPNVWVDGPWLKNDILIDDDNDLWYVERVIRIDPSSKVTMVGDRALVRPLDMKIRRRPVTGLRLYGQAMGPNPKVIDLSLRTKT